ncbi:Crp/Fnr family transcriptional regulator [Cereibacter changlensis]|nr:Crp/Fnr family transcriptional regulator [Cereibacter changlensis]PZX48273.1 CRP-like cAMP-binding protein [Cereibacter changlensis]
MLVESGSARVFLNCGARELTLCHLRAGGVFSTHTRAWMGALEHSEIRSWPLSAVMGVIAEKPALGAAAFRDVGQILSGALTLIEDLAFRPVEARLASHLLRQREKLGTDTLQIGHTGALAETLGASRQTLSSQVNRLIREGLLARPDRRTLVLLDPGRLRALSEVSAS